jgi:radical SAM protein with 4Fe4S-binding SPASM domain
MLDRTLISKLSFKKIWNVILLRFSYRLGQITKKPRVFGVPVSVSIEPTTACNLSCPECPSGLKQFTRKTGNLKVDMNKKILDQLGSKLLYINYYFQGEPFINAHVFDMIREASQRKIYTSTSTNAHFIDDKVAKQIVDSGLNQLIVSIDGTTQETYESYRIDGSLSKVLEGTKHIVKARGAAKHLKIVFQFLVVKPNEHQIEDVFKLAKEYGVDEVRLKTAQFYSYENGNELMPENDKYSRYVKKADGTYRLKNKMRNACWRMWSSCVFTWNGIVVPCCFDKDAKHQMGSVQNDPFQKIWKSSTYLGFRKGVLSNRSQIDICKNCSEGSKVWA